MTPSEQFAVWPEPFSFVALRNGRRADTPTQRLLCSALRTPELGPPALSGTQCPPAVICEHMKRLLVTLALLAAILTPATASAQASCQFSLGFKSLHDSMPAAVGDCTESEHYNANGDSNQQTTTGLLAWRKADNWTAFTDGYRTWLAGPSGLVNRLNTQRFSWEADYGTAGTTAGATLPATAAAPVTTSSSTSQPAGYTVNAGGQLITPSGNVSREAPASPTIPSGATGHCNDGTYSFAANHRGMCSSHGGVAQFYS